MLGNPGSSLPHPLGLGQMRTVVQHDRDSFHDAVEVGERRDSQISTRPQRPVHHVLQPPNITRRVGEGWEGAPPQPASPSCQPSLRSVLLFSSSIHSLSECDRQGSAGGARVSPSGRPNLRDTPIPGSYIPEQSLLRNRCAEGRGTFTPEQVSPVLRPRGAEVKSVWGGRPWQE